MPLLYALIRLDYLVHKIASSIGCVEFCLDQPKVGDRTPKRAGGGMYVGGIVEAREGGGGGEGGPLELDEDLIGT